MIALFFSLSSVQVEQFNTLNTNKGDTKGLAVFFFLRRGISLTSETFSIYLYLLHLPTIFALDKLLKLMPKWNVWVCRRHTFQIRMIFSVCLPLFFLLVFFFCLLRRIKKKKWSYFRWKLKFSRSSSENVHIHNWLTHNSISQ